MYTVNVVYGDIAGTQSEGGRDMLDEYIRLYGGRLFGLCLTLCASRFEAEDLYQETWLRAMTGLAKYDASREFEPWLTRICVNIYRSRLRRLARSPVYDGFARGEEKDAAIYGAAQDEPEDYGELRAAVERLPEKLRVTVILFYFRDMDVAKTAETLKIPAGTVKSRLDRARRRLGKELGDEGNI